MAAGRRAVTFLALCCASVVSSLAAGQVDVDDVLSAEEPPAVDDEVVVRGRRGGVLRLEMERAQNAVFARFNEINSDDGFDIVCRREPPIGTRITRRICQSNDWREQDANFANAMLRQLRGEGGPSPEQFTIEQRFRQRLLADEMQRLVFEDEQLYQALQRFGKARLELAEYGGATFRGSFSRQVIPGEAGLPLDANRMFYVWIGADRWSHRLTLPTFGVAQISGKIRTLDIQCSEGREQHEYEDKLAWTLPADWSACVLLVDAKRKTEFALYEFEQ